MRLLLAFLTAQAVWGDLKYVQGVLEGISSMDQARDIIYETLQAQAADGESVSDYAKCDLSADEDCSMAKMPHDETTVVYPGGETTCISESSSPFGFQVIPGDSDKLMFYFQGGGACWDRISTDLRFCTYDAVPSSQVGIFDREDERNPYRHYTVVQVLYCSGDVHGGDTTRPYTDARGRPVVQKGIANVKATIEWVKQQQAAGLIASSLDSLYVSGCSAGSIGAQLWAKVLYDTFPTKHIAITPDSYAGVFPQAAEGPLIQGFGYCESDIIPEGLAGVCDKGELKIQAINYANMHQLGGSPFQFIQSKRDTTQMAFYYAIAMTTNNTLPRGEHLTSAMFYNGVNRLFEIYDHEPSFAYYLVDGPQHCYTNKALYYTANPLSASGDHPCPATKLYEWVNTLETAASGDGGVEKVCSGPKKATDPDTFPTYCDEELK